jgi:uncharacterized protein (DUF2236 family)
VASTDVLSGLRDGIRLQLGRAIRHQLVGDQVVVRDLSKPVDGDPGLFGPGSVTWKVHADAAMLVGGIRALLLQTMHPLAMAGVADHSAYKTDPTGRLWRTSEFVGTTTFGSTEEAERSIAMVKRVHVKVKGTAPDGRAYSANDPHLMAWVHHALTESFLVAYQRYGALPLSATEADRYISEQATLAEMMGATDPGPARSVAEMKAWMVGIRPELKAGKQAREAVRFLATPPLPLLARAPYTVLGAAAVGLLPGPVTRALRIPVIPLSDPLLVRPATKAMAAIIGWAMTGPLPDQLD